MNALTHIILQRQWSLVHEWVRRREGIPKMQRIINYFLTGWMHNRMCRRDEIRLMKWDVHLSAWVKTWRCGRRSIIMAFWNDGITLPSAMADPTDAMCTLAHGFRRGCRRGRRSIIVI